MLISNFQNGRKNGKDDFNIMSPNSEKVYIFHTSNAEKKALENMLGIKVMNLAHLLAYAPIPTELYSWPIIESVYHNDQPRV